MTHFFRAVKVLPVERGAGLHQLGMRAAENRLNEGDWIHIFPGATLPYHSLPIYASFLAEGTRSRTGELLPPREGIGKLVANCDQLPVVIPFVHSGMQTVMPSGSFVPKLGNKVQNQSY